MEIELKLSQSAIGPAVKNPILTGVILSDRFCARYSPPQPGIIHFQSDADGQLSLLNFEIESASEPPDADDFESLDAFREALARWDGEHPEELAVSLDYFCERDPCPDTAYELAQVVEVAPGAIESSITFNFFIPVFGCAGDRINRNFDEPPTAGVGARWPQPTPLSFLPMFAQTPSKLNLNSPKPPSNSPNLCQRDRTNRNFGEPPDTGIYARLPKLKPPTFPLTVVNSISTRPELNSFAAAALFSSRPDRRRPVMLVSKQ